MNRGVVSEEGGDSSFDSAPHNYPGLETGTGSERAVRWHWVWKFPPMKGKGLRNHTYPPTHTYITQLRGTRCGRTWPETSMSYLVCLLFSVPQGWRGLYYRDPPWSSASAATISIPGGQMLPPPPTDSAQLGRLC